MKQKDLYTRACCYSQPEAMVELCTRCSQQVYYVSLLLTGQEHEAVTAARYAYGHLWETVTACEDDDMDTLEGYYHFVLNLAVRYCKAVYADFHPKDLDDPFLEDLPVPPLLDHPDLEDFALPETWGSSNSPFSLVQDLPLLPRFFLVMSTVGGYSQAQLAQSFGMELDDVEAALDALHRQLDQRLAPSQRSYQWLVDALNDEKAQTTVPPAVLDHIQQHTRDLTEPAKQYQRKQGIFTIVAIIIVILAALWELGILHL